MNTYNDKIEFITRMLLDKTGALTLTTIQVANLTGKSEITLKNHRRDNVGIPFLKLGGSIRYSIADVAKYIVEASMMEVA